MYFFSNILHKKYRSLSVHEMLRNFLNKRVTSVTLRFYGIDKTHRVYKIVKIC